MWLFGLLPAYAQSAAPRPTITFWGGGVAKFLSSGPAGLDVAVSVEIPEDEHARFRFDVGQSVWSGGGLRRATASMVFRLPDRERAYFGVGLGGYQNVSAARAGHESIRGGGHLTIGLESSGTAIPVLFEMNFRLVIGQIHRGGSPYASLTADMLFGFRKSF